MAKQRIDYLKVDRLDIQETLVAGGTNVSLSSLGTSTDEKAKVSATDTTPGFLQGKLVAGTNITLTRGNAGANETLTIASSGGSPAGYKSTTGFTGNSVTEWSNNSVVIGGENNVINSEGGNCSIVGGGDNTITHTNGTLSYNTILGGRYNYIVNSDGNSRSHSSIIASTSSEIDNASGYIVAGGGGIDSGSGFILGGSGGFSYTGSGSCVFGGNNNISQGTYSVAIGGEQAYAYGPYSFCAGERGTANQYGQRVWGAKPFSAQGDCQSETMDVSIQTTSGTPTVLTANRSAASSTNVMAVPSNTAKAFSGLVVARRNDAGGLNQTIAWKIDGLILNDAGTTSIIGSPTITTLGDTTSSGASITVTADNTLDCLVITATGGVGKTFRWHATVNFTII